MARIYTLEVENKWNAQDRLLLHFTSDRARWDTAMALRNSPDTDVLCHMQPANIALYRNADEAVRTAHLYFPKRKVAANA